MDIKSYIKKSQQRINRVLKKELPSIKKEPIQLNQAMSYATLNGGKRLRATLVYAVGEAFKADAHTLDLVAAAIEFTHAFSLIHDDLPALDNDDLRRGKPTCHLVFGEDVAIMAGDSLQSLAIETITKIGKGVRPEIKLQMISYLAKAIGSAGLCGGEVLDLRMVNRSTTVDKLIKMYQLKTGSLIKASIMLAAWAANCKNKKILTNLEKFAENIGLAFQIHDDIIGIESDTKVLGKQQGNDLALNKPVYPVIAGMKQAKEKELHYYKKALKHLDACKINAKKLQLIAAYIIQRNY